MTIIVQAARDIPAFTEHRHSKSFDFCYKSESIRKTITIQLLLSFQFFICIWI